MIFYPFLPSHETWVYSLAHVKDFQPTGSSQGLLSSPLKGLGPYPAHAGCKLPLQALLLTHQSSDLTTDAGTGQPAPLPHKTGLETATHRP